MIVDEVEYSNSEEQVILLELSNAELQAPGTVTARPSTNFPRQNREDGLLICAICKRYIIDDTVLRISEWFIHDCCARCAECGSMLNDELSCFIEEAESGSSAVPRLLCYADYVRLFTQRCATCRDLIVSGDLVMRAAAKPDGDSRKSERLFHHRCFRCAFCGIPISSGQTFKFSRGALRCVEHFNELLFPIASVATGLPRMVTTCIVPSVVPVVSSVATQDLKTAPFPEQANVLVNAQNVRLGSFTSALNSQSDQSGLLSVNEPTSAANARMVSCGELAIRPQTSAPVTINCSAQSGVSSDHSAAILPIVNSCDSQCSKPKRKSSCSKSRNLPAPPSADAAVSECKQTMSGVVLPFPIKERRGGRQRGVPSKRPRTVLTPFQREQFEKIFTVVHKPNRKLRDALARQYHLTARVVQVWFQNQRAKEKRIAMGLPASASAAAKHMRMMNALALAGKLPPLGRHAASSGSNSNAVTHDEDADVDLDAEVLDSNSSVASNTQADSSHSSSKRNGDIDLAALNITLNLNLNLDLDEVASRCSSNSN